MTRINATIPPNKLCDQHLLAEYRELPRIIALAKNWDDNNELPKKFTLGKGHVRFFYDKLFFLHKRYDSIVAEMRAREYKVSLELIGSVTSSFLNVSSKYYNDYEPTPAAHLLLSIRLKERLYNMTTITYYGTPVTAEDAFNAITKITSFN